MSFLGATRDEILLVAFIVILVVAAPKVPKLGEWIGGLFEGPKPDDGPRSPSTRASSSPGDPRASDKPSDGAKPRR